MLIVELIILGVLLAVSVFGYLYVRKLETDILLVIQRAHKLVMSASELNKQVDGLVKSAEHIYETCVAHYDYYIERCKQEDLLPEPKIEDEWADFMGQDGLFSAKALRENKLRKGI